MDIQKEREAFEAWYRKEYDNTVIDDSEFSEILDEYESNYYWVDELNQSWKAWQAAKTQAVPDVQQALNDRLLVRSIKEQVESHIDEISVNDLFDKGWFAAMKCIQSNIDMLKAREPAND